MTRTLRVVGLLLYLLLFGWLLLFSPLLGLLLVGDLLSMLRTGLFLPPNMPLFMLMWMVTGAWYLHRNASLRAASDRVPVLRPALTMSVAMVAGLTLTSHAVYILLQGGAPSALAWLAAGSGLVSARAAMSWWYARHPLVA